MISKQEAQYLSPSPASQQCGNCVMFQQGNCELVSGPIEPVAVCKYWEPEPGLYISPHTGKVVP